jgi:beta-N-acetylhexosaminidase
MNQQLKLLLFLCLLSSNIIGQKATLEEKIGQMIMIGLPDNIIDTNSLFYKDISNGKVGGITMYERHLTATNAAENLKRLISTYQAASPTPLFVSITQEGGLVNRLKTKYGFPPMPSAEYLGHIDNLDTTKYYADNIAYTLSRLGININFAPVLDIYSATNPVLGSRERTFSANTGNIVKHAKQVILSHNYFKVNTVVKHFPGHGSSTEDSHLGVTDVSKTWKQEELRPYSQLVKMGLVKGVMTAHIINTNLDNSKRPATLSKKVITGLLRKKLKFKGVIFSDDMHMKAISAEYSLKETIEMSIMAGVDVMLFSGNTFGKTPTSASEIVNVVLELIKENKVSHKAINASYKRIMKMKNMNR